MSAVHYFFRIIHLLVTIVVVGAAGLLILSALPSADVKILAVLSGSMAPSITVGSAVAVRPAVSYSVEDVIAFNKGKAPLSTGNNIVTHRIVASDIQDGEKVYLTKGDANEEADSGWVREEQIVGRVMATVPYLGYVSNWIRTPAGFVALIVLPAAILIYGELVAVKNELAGWWAGRRKMALAALLVAGLGLGWSGGTKAWLIDSEVSEDNFIRAWIEEPEPTPVPEENLLVINEVLPDSSCFQGQTEAQWLEVFNGSAAAVNLKNYQITDGSGVLISLVSAGDINVAAGELALLAHNNSIWNQCYDDNGVQTANLGGQLDFDTKFLQLLDGSGVVLDTVQWGPDFGSLNPIQDESIEREPDGMDSVAGVAFEASDFVVRPTPRPGI
jgi:signal peptidase I